MKRVKKFSLIAVLAIVVFYSCTEYIPELPVNGEHVELNINVRAIDGQQYITRAADMDLIDNVYLLLFEDTDGVPGLSDGDKLVVRRYFEYGTRQRVFVKPNIQYYIYAIANLDDSNSPTGSLSDFFDEFITYGDFKEAYVQYMYRTPDDVGKVIMASDAVQPIMAQGMIPDIYIDIRRLYAKFVVNIFNRVESLTNPVNISGVFPASIHGIDFPRASYLIQRNSPKEDMVSEGYYDTSAVSLELTGTEEIIQHPYRPDRFYTRQTVEFYCFENRKGTVPGLTNVRDRNALAPHNATHIRITSLKQATQNITGEVLLTWIHAGQGRTPESNLPDNITDYTVDRNSIYHFNIYINGTDEVEIDSRREILPQYILFELPTEARRIDAHYVDMPAYVSSVANGYVKLQSAAGNINPDGSISGLRLMQDTDVDADRWLRFSMSNPAIPFDYTTTTYNPSASTSVYMDMPEGDEVVMHRTILHFNEWVDSDSWTLTPLPIVVPVEPPTRGALIRVGFVEGAHSPEAYELGVLEGREVYYYVPVRQYGMISVGRVGGYNGTVYPWMLGVESVEEHMLQYYDRTLMTPPPLDVANSGGLYWRFRTAPNSVVGVSEAYDGLGATRTLYNDYIGAYSSFRPPVRGEVITSSFFPAGANIYNPFSNTNAADYCMRKNRDENGDGIISGDEVKWYLPTPVQLMQMYEWREAFRLSVNFGYNPFGLSGSSASQFYWTTNEASGANAFAVDFGQAAVMVTENNKDTRRSVRCVRDIDDGGAGDQGMFYYKDGHLVADLTGSFPNLVTNKPGMAENELRLPGNNTLAHTFLIAKFYANPAAPAMTNGNNNLCDTYSEPGFPAGSWFLPSQRELSFIYAYAGMIESVLEEGVGAPPSPTNRTTWHRFIYTPGGARHWGVTNVGNNSTYWNVDFATGSAATLQKAQNTGFWRCVTYLTAPL